MVSVDMRTRLDADVVVIDPVTFVVDELGPSPSTGPTTSAAGGP